MEGQMTTNMIRTSAGDYRFRDTSGAPAVDAWALLNQFAPRLAQRLGARAGKFSIQQPIAIGKDHPPFSFAYGRPMNGGLSVSGQTTVYGIDRIGG
jgi:hypothetical protein